MKKAIIIIISVLVVAAGTCTGLYFFTDVFNFLKPASDNFSMQAKKLVGNEEEPQYSEYEEFLNNLKTDASYSADLNMSMNLNLPSSVIDYSTQKLINSSSIKYKGSYDAGTKAILNDIGLYNNSKEVLALSILAKDTAISISSKDLYDKYLTMDLSKYESFCKANNMEVDEETKQSIEALSKVKEIDSAKLAYDLYYISEDDFNALHKNYGNILVDLVDEELYTTKKNQEISVDGEDVKTTAYSLTMSGEDAFNFTNKFIDLVKNDSTIKKLIVEKYNVIREYSKSYAGMVTTAASTQTTELPELTESEIDSFLSYLVEELEDAKEDFKDSDNEQCIKLTIYSNKKNEPIKFEMAILDDKEDEEGSVIFTEELAEGKNTYTIDLENISKLSGEESDDEDSSSYNSTSSSSSLSSTTSSIESIASSLSEIIIEDEYEIAEDSRKGTITISAKASGSKQDMLEIKYDTVNSSSESKFNLSVSSPLTTAISLDLVCETTGLDTDTQKVNFSLSGKYSAYSVKFAMDGSVKSGAEIPELNDSNSVDVFTLSEEDLMKVCTDIITKAADVLPSKLAVYGADISKEDILSILPQTTTPTEGTVVDPNTTPAEGTTTPDTTTTTTDASSVLTEEQKKQIEQVQKQAEQLQQHTQQMQEQAEQIQQQIQSQLQ
ncbi:MAG: hypothetical protein J6A89_08940 [Clostridia bacterium]|nr:hypothetical protein [Clostridia bacterium]